MAPISSALENTRPSAGEIGYSRAIGLALTCSGGNLSDEVILSYEMSLDVLPQQACVAQWNKHVLVRVNPSADMIHDR